MKQARIAETEKYAHVTFFFNGGVEEPNEGEDRILVPSPKEVADLRLKTGDERTGSLRQAGRLYQVRQVRCYHHQLCKPGYGRSYRRRAAAIKAIETVDACVGQSSRSHQGSERRHLYLCRPRKRRAAGRLEHRRAVDRSYHQPGTVYPG
ncbi:MAG: hypothetical protein ACLR8P_22655 [Clostridium fessum]